MKVGYARFFLCLFQRHGQKTEQGSMSDYVIENISEFVEGLLPSMDLELVEIQYRQEGEGWVLRLFIDGPDGIGLDQCTKVSREVSFFLDVEDIIPHAFNLEVSSPGLERPLHNAADFKRFAGKKARVKVRHPIGDQKVFTGLIGESDENGFELLFEDGTSNRFLMDQIRKARLSL
ncbi:MAG: ribosome maturation factor RimP [Thermodesulfobacteriota bacterium]|nr:ribosome maturation factor RimP [Thermodesulfobacteriota bacterium]